MRTWSTLGPTGYVKLQKAGPAAAVGQDTKVSEVSRRTTRW